MALGHPVVAVVNCMLVALSLLALVGLRYPVKMLPVLLFESAWKLIWLGAVALPLWLGDGMDHATREVAGAALWVVIIIAVVPWHFASGSTWPLPASAGDHRPEPVVHMEIEALTAIDAQR
ncbi:hypothetical protein GCM10009682_62130 [Luedemannella flava]|uniref:Uncharacterized protein n=1 Tax=Luedemannella flava TaxID=349316 RepID=A0ABP4Z4F2_9ACTN